MLIDIQVISLAFPGIADETEGKMHAFLWHFFCSIYSKQQRQTVQLGLVPLNL